ncbi:FIG00636416: hypothetical protein [hydrothermal vent metagenome]|uniref:DUF2793 domain-containing protein n=1 Tax=hydrothermal vent metagenome TaxID=652676 RepID=A0A3B0RZ00_9ZZZZ
MNPLQTPRFSLPLLAAGQAHKELFHNEALTLLDLITDISVVDIQDDPASLTPAAGDSWLVGSSPVAEWADYSNHIAGWSAGGWRFISPRESMRIFVADIDGLAVFRNGIWQVAEQIFSPAGGAVIDNEARTAIESILATLETFGLLRPSV